MSAIIVLGILLGIIIFLLGRYIPNFWIIYKESQGRSSSKFFNKYTKNCDWENGIIPAYICFIGGSITSFLFIILNLYNLLYLLIAPKLYLIEYFIK